MQLEQTLEQEQEQQVSKLMKKIEKLEKDTMCKQGTLEQVTVKCLQSATTCEGKKIDKNNPLSIDIAYVTGIRTNKARA